MEGPEGGGGRGTNPISQPIFFQIPLPIVEIPFPPAEFRKKSQCYTYQLFFLRIHKITASKYDPTLSLIHQEVSFQFYGKYCLQTHGTAMGTKIAAFDNTFMAKVETEILIQIAFIEFIEQANKHHPTIQFTAEISKTETTFLDTNIYKGERFRSNSVLDVRTHFKSTETFQFTHFSSCHPPGVKKGFIKGEALGLLRTDSSKKNIGRAKCF